ncbi:MAG: hypothetical protein EXR52_06825 [Dehalococcoidia bacterium]|nr:hypothetical protein [Dehalococcoidia bacterium]
MTISASGQAIVTEMTTHVKPGKRRSDSAGMMGTGATSTYNLDTGDYTCSGQGATGTCTKLTAAERTRNPVPEDLTKVAADYETSPAGQRQVTGQNAQCFMMKAKVPTASFSEATTCMTASGIQVYMQAKMAQGEFIQEATSVSTTVSDADFQLPYSVVEVQIPTFPGFPAGQLPPGFPSGQLPPGIPSGQLPPGIPRQP